MTNPKPTQEEMRKNIRGILQGIAAREVQRGLMRAKGAELRDGGEYMRVESEVTKFMELLDQARQEGAREILEKIYGKSTDTNEQRGVRVQEEMIDQLKQELEK